MNQTNHSITNTKFLFAKSRLYPFHLFVLIQYSIILKLTRGPRIYVDAGGLPYSSVERHLSIV